MFSIIGLSLLIQATLTTAKWITVDNGGKWGVWGPQASCPPQTAARGFSIKVESAQGQFGDDTALNAIKLFCAPPSSTDYKAAITSTEGPWGTWGPILWCPDGILKSFALQVEPPMGFLDDTAANNINFECTDQTVLRPNGGRWGTFGKWSESCPNGICAIQTKVEPPGGDDTALNDVTFGCC